MRSLLAWVVVPLSVSSVACSLLHTGASGDAGASDAEVVTVDAAPNAPPPTADNVNQVARFPDEAALNDVSAKVADPHVAVRNSVPGGALVATLNLGTPVIQIASHDNFDICSFNDPKNPTHTLEGWIAQEAFIPGPTPAPKGGCGGGQVMLTIDEQNFCGRECKADANCPSGQTCSGKANLYVAGKPGAEVATCTIPAPGTTPVTPSGSTATIIGVQQPAGPNGTCPAKYILASDKICHFECNISPKQCPPKSRCTATLTTAMTPVCEEAH